jgi:hypothetical protein
MQANVANRQNHREPESAMRTPSAQIGIVILTALSLSPAVQARPAFAAAAGPGQSASTADKSLEAVIEWGFQKDTAALAYDGRIEATQVAREPTLDLSVLDEYREAA